MGVCIKVRIVQSLLPLNELTSEPIKPTSIHPFIYPCIYRHLFANRRGTVSMSSSDRAALSVEDSVLSRLGQRDSCEYFAREQQPRWRLHARTHACTQAHMIRRDANAEEYKSTRPRSDSTLAMSKKDGCSTHRTVTCSHL